MSSYVIVDVGELADLLIEVWAASSRRHGSHAQADAEALRREKERFDREEAQAREAEQALDTQYREALAQFEAHDGHAAVRSHAEQIAQLQHRRSEIQNLARTLLAEVDTLGTSFLADFTNYHDAPALYQEIAFLKQEIQKDAAQILEEDGLLTEYDADGRFEALDTTIRRLEASYDALISLFAQHQELRGEALEKSQRLSGLLGQLASGIRSAAERVEVLPRTLPGAAAEAQAVRYALDTVRHYLLGPQSALLSKEQRQEVARLYGLHGSSPLREIAAADPLALKSDNEQFRAAKKRRLDRTISENARALRELRAKYLTMYETVFGKTAGARDTASEAGGDVEHELALLRSETERLSRRYYQVLRQQLLEDTLSRALARSRPGMQVRQIGSADTGAGNRRLLYQIGSEGTAMEVYTDARGQVLIEAGSIVAQDGPATEAQRRTMERNLDFFCSHELPDILDSLERELKASRMEGTVKLRREPAEDRLHLFTLEAYPAPQGALILEEDGSVRRRQAAEPAKLQTLDEEPDGT